jgi:hypothetical protein
VHRGTPAALVIEQWGGAARFYKVEALCVGQPEILKGCKKYANERTFRTYQRFLVPRRTTYIRESCLSRIANVTEFNQQGRYAGCEGSYKIN